MSQIKISELPDGIPKLTDVTPGTDITDLSSATSGTTKKYTRQNEVNFYASELNLNKGSLYTIYMGNGFGNIGGYSSASYLNTTTKNSILYSSVDNVISEVDSLPDAVLVYDNTGAPFSSKILPLDVQDSITSLGTIASIGSPLSSQFGGTGANNSAHILTYGGNLNFANSFTTSGAFSVTQTYTGITNVTFPTSGTLATTSQLPVAAALTRINDTNVTLTLGGSPTTSLLNSASITAGWTGQLSSSRGGTGINNGTNTLTYGGNLNFANSFTTSGAFSVTQTYTGITNVTFPTSGTLATTSQLPVASALTSSNDSNVTLSLSSGASTALLNATSITAGWTGLLPGTRGGTGVNNGSRTATYAGNLNFANAFTTSGAFPVTQTYTGTTNVTFPTSGTLSVISDTFSTKTSDYTLTLADNGTTIICNSTSNFSITFPEQSTTTLPVGYNVNFINIGLGDVRFLKQGFDVFYQESHILGKNAKCSVQLITAGSPNYIIMTGGTVFYPVSFQFYLATGSNSTFDLISSAPFESFVLTRASGVNRSGNITASFSINGVAVTGQLLLNPSTRQHVPLSGLNSGYGGEAITVTFSSSAAALDITLAVSGYARINQ